MKRKKDWTQEDWDRASRAMDRVQWPKKGGWIARRAAKLDHLDYFDDPDIPSSEKRRDLIIVVLLTAAVVAAAWWFIAMILTWSS